MEGQIFWQRQRNLSYRILAANICKAQAYALYQRLGPAAVADILGVPGGQVYFPSVDQLTVVDSNNRVCVYFSNAKSWKVRQGLDNTHYTKFYSLPWAWEDRLSELPTVLLLLIANMLPVDDLFTLRRVSSRIRNVCSNDILWAPRVHTMTLRLLRYGIETKLAEAGYMAAARLLLFRTETDEKLGCSSYETLVFSAVMTQHPSLTPRLTRYRQIIAENI
jgi:hypothetical protein